MEENFIPQTRMEDLLASNQNDESRLDAILARSLAKNRLEPEEMATLLQLTDPALREKVFEAAARLKREIYGNRIVLFAPLYIGNKCINDCEYCGFRTSNHETVRTTLTDTQLEAEVRALQKRGHKRLILVYGEHPHYGPEFIRDTAKLVYSIKEGPGEIRRVNINAAPLEVEGFKTVKSAGIGTYQIFMETYHRPTYEKVHHSGPKANYLWRLQGLDRAQLGGIDDVGIGALIGLYDWRYEALGLLYHTIHLEERFKVGPHTISFPRIEPAFNTDFSQRPPYAVSDEDFKYMVAVIRLAVPYTGMILTAREPEHIRRELIRLGVSQIDAGSHIGIGEYAAEDDESIKKSQFCLGDRRSLAEVMGQLLESKQIPSFCTGCYRVGRTGEHFMEFAIPGFVKRYCTPNALLTLKEYLLDYADADLKNKGEQLIRAEVQNLEPAMRTQVQERLLRVEQGERDLYF